MYVKLLSNNAKVPTKANKFAAGYDLYTANSYIVHPGRNVLLLDIAIDIPDGYEGHIRPRSGFSSKGMQGHEVNIGAYIKLNKYDADVIQGTIDSDYRGNVGVIVKSYESKPFVIEAGTRIAQLVISPILFTDELALTVVDELSETERGVNGFGSTGTK